MSTPSPVTDPGAPAPGPVRRAAGAARTLAADDVRAWLRLDDGRDVELVVDRVHELAIELGATIVHPPETGNWAPGYYSVLFEDPDVLVVDKPAGLPVHAGPRGGHRLEQRRDAVAVELARGVQGRGVVGG